jgi:uncharacterized protein RhaS with RHS repeats
MYNPTLGTFIQRDPIAADPNLYRYCGNNPVSYTDPDGMQSAPGMKPADELGKKIDKNASTEKGKALGDLLKEDKELRRRLIDKAKDTREKERGGVVTKPTDPKKGNKHTVVEENSEKNDERYSDIRTWPIEGKHYVPKKRDSNGGIDLNEIPPGTELPRKDLDEENEVVFKWHTHTRYAEAGPSDRDIRVKRKTALPGVMIEKVAGVEYRIWIIDEHGDYYPLDE